jgi:hypothetical protein
MVKKTTTTTTMMNITSPLFYSKFHHETYLSIYVDDCFLSFLWPQMSPSSFSSFLPQRISIDTAALKHLITLSKTLIHTHPPPFRSSSLFLSLLQVEYINQEEVVEVTPSFMRMSKRQGWDTKNKSGRG